MTMRLTPCRRAASNTLYAPATLADIIFSHVSSTATPPRCTTACTPFIAASSAAASARSAATYCSRPDSGPTGWRSVSLRENRLESLLRNSPAIMPAAPVIRTAVISRNPDATASAGGKAALDHDTSATPPHEDFAQHWRRGAALSNAVA